MMGKRIARCIRIALAVLCAFLSSQVFAQGQTIVFSCPGMYDADRMQAVSAQRPLLPDVNGLFQNWRCRNAAGATVTASITVVPTGSQLATAAGAMFVVNCPADTPPDVNNLSSILITFASPGGTRRCGHTNPPYGLTDRVQGSLIALSDYAFYPDGIPPNLSPSASYTQLTDQVSVGGITTALLLLGALLIAMYTVWRGVRAFKSLTKGH